MNTPSGKHPKAVIDRVGRKCVCGKLKSWDSRQCAECRKLDGHGYSTSGGKGHMRPEYAAYQAMKQRCHNPKHPAYYRYGGRGIRVCRAWRRSFAKFLADVGERPSGGYSLDRYPNNNGHYEPSNVRWATKPEQQINRNVSLGIRNLDDERMTLGQVAYELAMSYSQCRTAFVRAGIIPVRSSDPKYLQRHVPA